MGHTSSTDVAAADRVNSTTTPNNLHEIDAKPSVQSLIKKIEASLKDNVKAKDELKAEFAALGVESLDLAKEFARPTPGMLRAVNGLVRAYAAATREAAGYVGSARKAMPMIVRAVKAARDEAGAYTSEELDQVE